MTDPMQLLRASNPVHDCPAPDFERLLARLEHEPSEPPVDDALSSRRGRLVGLRTKKAPRITTGRRILAGLVPVAVALAVAAVAVVSLHGSGPPRTISSPESMAYPPGQAHGRVVGGSMHRFLVPVSSSQHVAWGAEWFRTTSGQICVQAGREVGGRLGYVDIDGIFPHDRRFHAWAPDTAVAARCIDRPAHGGIALMAVARVAESGSVLAAGGACTAALHAPCPAADTATLYFGLLGSAAAVAGYGTQLHPRGITLTPTTAPDGTGPGPGGEYLVALPTATNACSVSRAGCHARFPLPSHTAFVVYSGGHGTCTLHGPATDGLLAGDCPHGLTLHRRSSRHTHHRAG